MPASQHQNPKSDIEISQSAKKTPILEIAKNKLGIEAENLEPYGHYKAKISMDYIKSVKNKKDGKLILTFSGGSLQASSDLTHWNPVEGALGGTYEVELPATGKTFYRVAQ